MTEKRFGIHKIAYIFFWIGIICEFAVSFSGYLIGNYKEPLIIVAGMGCFAISILLNYDFKKLLGGDKTVIKSLVMHIIMIAVAVSCYISQHSALILRVALVLIAGNLYTKSLMDFEQSGNQLVRSVVSFFFWGTLAVMIVFAILSAMGLHNTLSMTQLFRHEPETRYCFGFFHPNGFSLFYMKVVLLGIYLYVAKVKKWIFPIILVIATVPLIMANSKMVILCYGIAVALFLSVKNIDKKDWTNIIYIVALAAIVAVIGLIIATAIMQPITNYGEQTTLWEYLNERTSGRLSSMSASFRNYSIPLFGYGNVLTTTENGFVNSIFSEGIIFVLVFFGVVIWLLRKMYKNKDCYGMIVVIVTFMNLFSESFMPYFNKNAIWMMLLGYF